jgi:hypothetical protein
MMIPTVVTDAWSNCRMTSAATIQRTPTISHNHQRLRAISAVSSPCVRPKSPVEPKSGVAAEPLVMRSSLR